MIMTNKTTATTKEFRNAMRTALRNFKVMDFVSYTEILRGELNKAVKSERRRVCFKIKNTDVNPKLVAFVAENILNKEGKTAHIRVGTRDSNYIRGNCLGVNFRKDAIKYPEFHEYKAKEMND